MQIPFEASNRFSYQFARYQALPEILALPEVKSGQPFRLIDLAKQVIAKHLTPEQQAIKVKRAQSDRMKSFVSDIKFYIPFIAKNTGQLTRIGDGMFKLPAAEDFDEDDVREAALADGAVDEETAELLEGDGWIYAFSFPALVKEEASFPIKVGLATKDVDERVAKQCRESAIFDNPVILGRWQVKRVVSFEKAIHRVLQSRGKWRENVPGKEWFDTTLAEIESIVAFVRG